MTIAKGEPWGRAVPRPLEPTVVDSDAALARLAEEHERGISTGPIVVTGGDLHRSLGAPPVAWDERDELLEVSIDLIRVETPERSGIAVAHLLARGSWWRGPILAVHNAEFRGGLDVAPRSHPNDGLLDVVEVAGSMGLRARLAARRRLATGTHVPHPQIATRRVPSDEWTFIRPRRLEVDGIGWGSVADLRVTVEPDALTICC